MSLKLSQVRKKRVPFTVILGAAEEGGEVLSLSGFFNPNCYTPEYLANLRDADTNNPDTWAGYLVPLVVTWELEYGPEDAEDGLCKPNEVGGMVPVTYEAIRKLPIDLLSKLISGIQTAGRPDPNSASPSGDSSLEEEEGPVLANTD